MSIPTSRSGRTAGTKRAASDMAGQRDGVPERLEQAVRDLDGARGRAQHDVRADVDEAELRH